MRKYTSDELGTIIEALDASDRARNGVIMERILADYRETRALELPTGPITKWDTLHPIERVSMLRTPFGEMCSGCGTSLPTEATFAQHFIVSDRRYLNLGSCPATKQERSS